MPTTFPRQLSSGIAYDMALAILDGFDRHYRLFRATSRAAVRHFEQREWQQAQQEAQARIDFYDRRVQECVQGLARFAQAGLTDETWREVKLHYIGLLTDHKQPELAETFFNSVCCRILHRTYFNNDFIFVRPVISTEYIESAGPAPTYRVYYPGPAGMRATLKRILTNFQLDAAFADLDRDAGLVEARLDALLGGEKLEPNLQLQVLASLFCRNKGAYVVGKIVNGHREYPLVIPVLHGPDGLVLDAVLLEPRLVTILFSFSRAYFMVDIEVPSAYVSFLKSLMPFKPASEIYTNLGLHKQGKALFYRDFQHHLRHSSDVFETAPGIRGLVMLVFSLPSFPYVFKVIKDAFPPPKETTREQVQQKYLLVKHHDRVGRMADTLEYSDVAFPRARFGEALLAELKRQAASVVEEEGEQIVIRHLYIERRMVPLNIWLEQARRDGDLAALEHGMVEYGNAIRDMMAVNIFPGDLLYKNFGVTRYGRVVFYDYDEVEYLSACNFRRIPEARTPEDEMSAEAWYPIARNDVFPEQFATFLLGDPQVRAAFLRHHAELLAPEYWDSCKKRILAGWIGDVFPYPQQSRFGNVPGNLPAPAVQTD
ncbi:MAG: bifunctional isocitrate dehydrogenase kinase/phosphatase [Paucimonas sp.]|nr:bifunctional isocitrate dehydrogenase kinase/phosphatase [Paucimonas sp.]